MAAAALGIRNLLLLQGRRSQAGRSARRQAGVRLRHRGADRGRGGACATRASCRPAARSAASADFFIAAADMPIDPPAGWEPKSLKGKIEAGCEFVQTQFCMDAGVVRRYMARLAEHGVPAAVPDRHLAAALGQVGALDEGKAVRHDHPRCDDRAAGSGRRSGRRRPQALPRSDARACRPFPALPACTSWRRTTKPRSPM